MTVLITGGAGFLGANLARCLLANGWQVASLDREPLTDADLAGRVVAYTADIRNAAAVDAVLGLSGARHIVHAAAALPLCRPEEIRTTDVEGTRILLEAARSRGIRRVVHISSTAVYGVPDHHPLVESDRLQGVGPYGAAKVAAEAVCQEYRERGMCIPVLRPKTFIGPERLGVFALLYDWALDRRNFPVIGSGRNRYQLLHVADLCEAIRLCLTLPQDDVNDTFNVGAAEFGTFADDLQAVLDAAGFGKKVVPLPERPAVALLRLLEALHLSPLYHWVYDTAARDSFVSVEKARERLGWSPRYSNRDALLDNFDWYRRNRAAVACRDTGVSHRVPWSQGALTLARRLF